MARRTPVEKMGSRKPPASPTITHRSPACCEWRYE
jgi:hypothetical protein